MRVLLFICFTMFGTCFLHGQYLHEFGIGSNANYYLGDFNDRYTGFFNIFQKPYYYVGRTKSPYEPFFGTNISLYYARRGENSKIAMHFLSKYSTRGSSTNPTNSVKIHSTFDLTYAPFFMYRSRKSTLWPSFGIGYNFRRALTQKKAKWHTIDLKCGSQFDLSLWKGIFLTTDISMKYNIQLKVPSIQAFVGLAFRFPDKKIMPRILGQ